MKIFYTIIIALIILCSCQSQNNKINNTLPMYGEVIKTNEHKKIDEKFIHDCLEKFVSIDSAVKVQIDNAWRYYYNNDLETAMKRFNQAWLLNPEYPDSYFGFASILETKNKPIEAKRFYTIAVKKDTMKNRSEICYKRIADCKEQLKDIKGAISSYMEITKLNSNNSFAFKKIGYFQMQSGNSNEALKYYNKAIEIEPKDAMTYNNRGYLNQTLNNYNEAIKDYSTAIELNPNYISALVNRGITEMSIKEFNNAKSDFKKATTIDTKSGELRRFLALSELALNEKTNACNNLVFAVELGDKEANKLIEENCHK